MKNDMEVIEYYYALASPWAYLGNRELLRIASEHNKNIDPIIINYDIMFEASGTIPLPERPPLRKSYRLIELARWSKKREVNLDPEPPLYKGETEEPNELLAALMVTALKDCKGDSLAFSHAISRALWAEGKFPFTETELLKIAYNFHDDPKSLLETAQTPKIRELYAAQTKRAVERGVFGMPFYIFQDIPFWGQDRLEMLEDTINQV